MYLRLGSRAAAGRLTAALLACCCGAAACGGPAGGATVAWTITPTPPVAQSEIVVALRLADRDGQAILRARLQLDAHMSHPGMAPIMADVIEQAGGTYQARLRLPMPGDWLFVVTGTLADGSRLTNQVLVPAVRPAG